GKVQAALPRLPGAPTGSRVRKPSAICRSASQPAGSVPMSKRRSAMGSGGETGAVSRRCPYRHARPWAWHPRVDHTEAENAEAMPRLRVSAPPRAISCGKLVDARAKPWHDGLAGSRARRPPAESVDGWAPAFAGATELDGGTACHRWWSRADLRWAG